jgi:RNA polymerase sigma-32 factor
MARERRFETIARYRRMAQDAPILDAGTERELVRSFQSGDQRALTQLLTSHLRLVLAMARRYSNHGAPIEDLVSEGNLGLVEAARRYDESKGTRFGTYASWWVRAHVRRYALANRRIVPAPSTRNARKVLSALRRTQRDISQRTGRAAERDEVAAELGVSPSDIAMVEAALGGRDMSIGPTDDGTVWEVPATTPNPEQETAEGEVRWLRKARVGNALAVLSEREREIVRRRYLEEDSATLAVLGQSLGLSRERVRQIEKRAQMKLRTALLDVA